MAQAAHRTVTSLPLPTKVSEESRKFGQKIFAFRTKCRVNLSELADMVDLSTENLLALERGRFEISPCKMSTIEDFIPGFKDFKAD